MGILQTVKNFVWNTGGVNIKTPANSGIKFFEGFDGITWEGMDSPQQIADWILKCPPLAFVLNRKAMAFVNGHREVLNVNTGNEVRGKDKEWAKLLANPNPLQTDRQFRVELYTYIQAFGYCPVLIDQPAGFTDFSKVQNIWVLPPNFCTIYFKDDVKSPFRAKDWQSLVDYIDFHYEGYTTRLNKSQVYFFTDITTNMDSMQFPDSKLIPLKYPINNIIKSYEARGVIADRRGAVGLLSNERGDNISTLPMTNKEIEETQNAYRKYGMNKDQWQLFITNIPMRYQQMAMPVKDMMLLEMEEADVRTICNALGYPYHLLSNSEGTTFSNMQTADASLYQNFIIPESMNFAEQLNKAIHAIENGVQITYDYSWLPVMQADEKLKAETRKRQGEALMNEFNMNFITWNQVREGLGLDKESGMDKYRYQLTEIYGTNTENTSGSAVAN